MDHETSPLVDTKMLEAKRICKFSEFASSWTPTSEATFDDSHQQRIIA